MAYVPLVNLVPQFFDNLGDPLVGGTLNAYVAGTSTPTNMFSDNTGTVAGTSVTLDSRGEPTTIKMIWLDSDIVYKFILKDSLGTTIWTEDNIDGLGVPDGSITTSKLASPIAPTASSLNGGQLAGFRNKLINPNFNVWQRSNTVGSGFSTAGYGPDRWYCLGSNATIGKTAAPEVWLRPQFSGGINSFSLRQVIPYKDTEGLIGKYATFSVNLKSLFSELSNKVTIQIHYNDTAETQTGGTWFSLANGSITPTSSFGTYSVTTSTVIPANAQSIRVSIIITNATVGNDMAIRYCQLEEGQLATPYEQRHQFIDNQLCLSFYETSYDTVVGGTGTTGCISQVEAKSTSQLVYGAIRFIQKKVSTPVVTIYAATTGTVANIRDVTAGADVGATAADVGLTGCRVQSTGTTFTAGNMHSYHYAANSEYT